MLASTDLRRRHDRQPSAPVWQRRRQSCCPNQVACSLRLTQARVRAIADIVSALVAGVRRGEDVDLNAIKREVGASPGTSGFCCTVE